MKEIKVNVYKYDELTPAAQEKAVQGEINAINEYFPSDLVTEQMEIILNEKGIEVDNVYWSLSYCQGDGVSFNGSFKDGFIEKLAEKHLSNKDYTRFKRLLLSESDILESFKIVKTSHRYQHEYTMQCELSEYLYLNYDSEYSWEVLNKLEGILTNEIHSIAKELEEYGYKEIEYQTSKETAEENIRSNDYDFYEDGSLYDGKGDVI